MRLQLPNSEVQRQNADTLKVREIDRKQSGSQVKDFTPFTTRAKHAWVGTQLSTNYVAGVEYPSTWTTVTNEGLVTRTGSQFRLLVPGEWSLTLAIVANSVGANESGIPQAGLLWGHATDQPWPGLSDGLLSTGYKLTGNPCWVHVHWQGWITGAAAAYPFQVKTQWATTGVNNIRWSYQLFADFLGGPEDSP